VGRADQPLSKDDVTLLLLAGSSSSNIVQTVEQRGVDFQMDPDLTKKFRDLGASDDLIGALQRAASKVGATGPGVLQPAVATRVTAQQPPVAISGPAGPGKPNPSGPALVAPAGTRIRVQLETGIDTRHSRTGEEVQATVIEPISREGQAIIPIGTSLSGRIDFVQPKQSNEKLRASVRLVFDTLTFPDHRALRCRAIISGVGFTFQVAPDGDVTHAPGDFELKRGRKLWVQVAEDLVLSTGTASSEAAPVVPKTTKMKDTHSVRMSELLVTATSVEDEPANKSSGPPHRTFVVHVRVQNVGKRFPCTSLNAYLVVSPLYEYPATLLPEEQPSTRELLPGETAEGQYSFDIRDGVVPGELLLRAEDSRESRCTEPRPWDLGSVWHYRNEGRIPIEGLATGGELAPEGASPPRNPETQCSAKTVQPPLASAGQKREVRQQPGSTIIMDDNFEYRVVDYGVGQVQIRPALSDEGALSQPVFWIEFGITNASEHLLGVPQYSPGGSVGLAVLDNWGNEYKARPPSMANIGGQTTLPLPPRKLGRYKPQESSLDLLMIPLEEFVKDIRELRIYLNRYPGARDWHYFLLREPMLRQGNLLRDQFKPPAAELAVSTAEEVQPPAQLPH
jgi:hypothetical protein